MLVDDLNEVEETLLQNDEAGSNGDHEYGRPRTRSMGSPRGQGRRRWFFLLLTALLLYMIEFADFLSGAPQQQVFLQIACDNHYGARQDTVGEKCRIEPVQSELAFIDGWMATFDQLPGIILSIPYGLLADRIGRKPVLLLGLIGILLSDIFVKLVCWWSKIFPLRMIWLAAFWRVVGGGNQVILAILFSILADTHGEEHRADAFFKLVSAIYLSEITAIPLAASLMEKNPWIPLFMSPVVLIATNLICLKFLPETVQESLRTDESSSNQNEVSNFEMQSPLSTSSAQRTGIFGKAREAVEFLLSRRNVAKLLFCFFAGTIGRKCMFLLLQYAYKKFGWTLAEASYLIWLRATINLANNLIILPLLTWLLMSRRFRFQLTAPFKDIVLSKYSISLLIAGCVALTLSSGIASLIFGILLFALGSCFLPLAQSLITYLVPSERVGMLYTTIGMVSGIGILISGPLLAQSFSIGMAIGEAWLGLPYAVSAGLFSMVAVAIWKVQLPASRRSFESGGIGLSGDT